MNTIVERITEAIKDILINFIQSGMEDMFVEVNNKVGTIAAQVGQTPQGWNGSVFSLIKNLSETVMVPIAGMIITFVLCYELITMVTQKNNFHEFETFNIFIWVFKAYIAIYLVTNTFNITMAVFDVGQHVVNGAAGVISGNTEIDATTAITNLLDTMEDMEVGELFLLALETMLISMTMKILSVAITVILYGRMMYQALENMGFEKGNILEPAMGVGNFFGMLPEKMEDSKLYGVELDSISGRIASLLYPDANIQIKGFEKTEYPNDFFDVVIGNVPFGAYKVNDRQYEKYNFFIHDYFLAKSIDQLRPGGVAALITTKGTMDKASPEVRRYLAERAELLGAIRLPNTAFSANAGTEVTADILFFQKRESIAHRRYQEQLSIHHK